MKERSYVLRVNRNIEYIFILIFGYTQHSNNNKKIFETSQLLCVLFGWFYVLFCIFVYLYLLLVKEKKHNVSLLSLSLSFIWMTLSPFFVCEYSSFLRVFFSFFFSIATPQFSRFHFFRSLFWFEDSFGHSAFIMIPFSTFHFILWIRKRFKLYTHFFLLRSTFGAIMNDFMRHISWLLFDEYAF